MQQAAQEITESVVNVARTELADISANQMEKTAEPSDHYVVMQLKDDVSNATKDLSTIIETLVSDETARMNGKIGLDLSTADNFLDVESNILWFLAGNAANNNQARRLHSKDNANTYVLVDALPNSSNNMISNRNCYTRIKMVCVDFSKTNALKSYCTLFVLHPLTCILQRSLSSIKGLPGEHVIPIEAFEMYEKWRENNDFIRNANNYLTMEANNLVIPHNSGAIGA